MTKTQSQMAINNSKFLIYNFTFNGSNYPGFSPQILQHSLIPPIRLGELVVQIMYYHWQVGSVDQDREDKIRDLFPVQLLAKVHR